jgi:uncharacterized membrane protein YdjX (TVP38/TMEM64 family)
VTAWVFLRRFGLLLAIAALFAAAAASGAWRWLTFDQLQAHHAQLQHLVARSPVVSAAAFALVFVAVVAACIPGPGLMATVSGYLFGTVAGGAISLAACVAGSAVVFLACRSAFAGWLTRRGGPRVRALEQELSANAFPYLVSLKLIPVVPMFVANVAAGLANVRLVAVVAATAVGSAPICFILAGLGAGLGRLMDRGASPGRHFLERPELILPLLGLSLLSTLSIAWRLSARRRPRPRPRGRSLPPRSR